MSKYAVLICGYHAKGWDEFWNDIVIMREMLLHNNFEDQNIFILYADGNDYIDRRRRNHRYDPEEINRPARPNRPNSFTDYPATKDEFRAVFNGLAHGDPGRGIPKMDENDFLFVWTFGHGYRSIGYDICWLWLEGEKHINDIEFAKIVNKVPCARRVLCMQQCFSGGFIENLQSDKTVILTCCNQYEFSLDWPNDNSPTQEVCEGIKYDHGEFNYNLASSLMEAQVNGGAPVNSDTSGNGLVSMGEAFEYIKEKNYVATERPQYNNGVTEEVYIKTI